MKEVFNIFKFKEFIDGTAYLSKITPSEMLCNGFYPYHPYYSGYAPRVGDIHLKL